MSEKMGLMLAFHVVTYVKESWNESTIVYFDISHGYELSDWLIGMDRLVRDKMDGKDKSCEIENKYKLRDLA